MTLIVTTISDLGILQASDSNLTDKVGRPAGKGKKVFPLGFCAGALALAGSYDVGGEDMSTWMPNAIADYAASTSPTLEGLARYFEGRLNAECDDETGLLLHIAGYVPDGTGSHAEMWFVRNYSGMENSGGSYIGMSDTFDVSEDFWGRDYPTALAVGHQPGESFRLLYFNGLPDARISYHALDATLWAFFRQVWAVPEWEFRPPRTIDELAALMRLELSVISALFEISDYSAPYVGGHSQIEIVPRPTGAVTP